MQRIIGLLFFMTVFMQLTAQEHSGMKSLSLKFPLPDSVQLDSFTVNPADIRILLPDGEYADTSYFRFDISKGLIYFNKEKFPDNGEVKVFWQAMSVNLSMPYKHKDTSLLFPELKTIITHLMQQAVKQATHGFYRKDLKNR